MSFISAVWIMGRRAPSKLITDQIPSLIYGRDECWFWIWYLSLKAIHQRIQHMERCAPVLLWSVKVHMLCEGLPKTSTSDLSDVKLMKTWASLLTCRTPVQIHLFGLRFAPNQALEQIRSRESIASLSLSGKYPLLPYFTGCEIRWGLSARLKISKDLTWSSFKFRSRQSTVTPISASVFVNMIQSVSVQSVFFLLFIWNLNLVLFTVSNWGPDRKLEVVWHSGLHDVVWRALCTLALSELHFPLHTFLF